jgi:hypothetical protein
LKLVAGLDLALRRDHSALVILDVAPDRLAARRLPQAPLREQFTLIAPHLTGLDRASDNAAAELLPKTPPHVGVCLLGGDRPLARSTQGLVFDQSGLGDAAAELLPKTPPHLLVCLIAGDHRSPAQRKETG